MADPNTIPLALSFSPPVDDAEDKDNSDRMWDILQVAHLETDSLKGVDWRRLDTIQLKTKSTGEYRDQKGKLLLTWFNIAIHRSKKWKRLEPGAEPRADFTHGSSLRWRSHTNQPKAWNSGQDFGCMDTPSNIEYGGRVFTQADELLKQLDYTCGDVIVVTLCARDIPDTRYEYEVQGELVFGFLDGDNELNNPMASYGRYRYWPTDSCYQESLGPKIESAIWFKSAPLDEVTISKLDTVRFFTESCDQQWVEDDRTASYSWFELVVLESENATKPKTKDGVELAWRSHSNAVDGDQLEILDGLLFTREDGLLRGLSPNNVIAARVCCRFGGWENNANDGCLELRFSPNDIKDQMKKFQISKEAEQIIQFKKELLELVSKMKIKLPTDVLAFLNERVQADSSIGDRPKLMLLSLDGGGVRGLASLYMLQALMEQIRVRGELTFTPEPYQVFDLMVGTSTGGLIAIMLGRLGMTLKDCIAAYIKFATTVFQKPKEGVLGWLTEAALKLVVDDPQLAEKIATLNAEGCYDSSILEKTIKDIVKNATGNENSMMEPEQVGEASQGPAGDSKAKTLPETQCRVVVAATATDNISGQPTPFRTYRMGLPENSRKGVKPREVKNCEIWKAARATSAAPFYFKSIDVDGKTYIDGGLQANNPVFQTVLEGMYLFKDRRPSDCLVSLGTGLEPDIPLTKTDGSFQATKAYVKLARAAIDRMTDRRSAHELMEDLNSSNTLAEAYYRFDPQLWDKHQEGKPDKLLGLEDVAAMAEFKDKVDKYTSIPEVREQIEGCAKKLAEKFPKKQA